MRKKNIGNFEEICVCATRFSTLWSKLRRRVVVYWKGLRWFEAYVLRFSVLDFAIALIFGTEAVIDV
jgi:hypothetical protein